MSVTKQYPQESRRNPQGSGEIAFLSEIEHSSSTRKITNWSRGCKDHLGGRKQKQWFWKLRPERVPGIKKS